MEAYETNYTVYAYEGGESVLGTTLYYLTDEGGNKLTDEGGNYLVAPFSFYGSILTAGATNYTVTAED